MIKSYRKVLCLFCSVVFLLNFLSLFSVAADRLTIKGVRSDLPDVVFEVSDKLTNEKVEAKINGKNYTITSGPTDVMQVKKLTCFVIDNSISMSEGTPYGMYDAAKADATDIISKHIAEKEHFMAFAVGQDLHELTLATDSAGAGKLCNEIMKLRGDERGVTLSAKLKDIHTRLSGYYDEYGYDLIKIILITDAPGNDANDAVDITSVADKYRYHDIPLYSVCLTKDKSSGNLKAFNRLSEDSGGYGKAYESGLIAKDYAHITTGTLYRIRTDLEQDQQEYNLGVQVEDKSLEAQFKTSAAQDISGNVTASVVENTKNSITIEFNRPVSGATARDSYDITRGNRSLKIYKIEYNKDNNRVVLTFQDDLYNGKYTFYFDGIHDTSRNQNGVDGITDYTIKNAKSPFWLVFPYLMIALALVIVLLAFYLILLHLKKKKNVTRIKELFETQVQETVEEHHHVEHIQAQPAGVPVRLTMQTGTFPVNKVNLRMNRSFIFGRSSECEVYTDDRKLSRQHFAVENINGIFMIQDLNTTNGTYLNGIKVIGRQKLKSGDVIRAGLTTIKIEF